MARSEAERDQSRKLQLRESKLQGRGCLENSMDREAWQATVHGHIQKQRHYFANKVRLTKAMIFPVSRMDVRVGL